jgi:hypothetical protein
MDRHPQFPKPAGDALEALKAQVTGPRNELGVKGVNMLFVKDGSSYCLMDAPDASAVLAAHRRNNVPLEEDDIREISLLV